MGNYVLALISVSLLNGVVSMLTPEGDIKKYVRFVGSLCVLLAIVVPIFLSIYDGEWRLDEYLGGEVDDSVDYEQIFEEYMAAGAADNSESALKSEIQDVFGLSPDSFDVELDFLSDGDRYKISSATLYLHSTGITTDPVLISSHISDRIGCDCEIKYD